MQSLPKFILFIGGWVLTLVIVHELVSPAPLVPVVYAYNTQEILNACYPAAHYGANQSCNASSIQAGASCAENVGGPIFTANECGCFGQNASHTYVITHHPTQCNDGSGNITQFETFECSNDLGVQYGQCGNPPPCTFAEDCEAPIGDGPHSGYRTGTGLMQNGVCAVTPLVPTNYSACIPKVNAEVIPQDANAAYDPRALSLGEPVNFYLSATRTCAQQSGAYSFDQGGGVYNNSPDGKCTLIQPMTCDKPNESGDWRKCWAKYECTSADKYGQFSATFANNNPSCTSKVDYFINKAKDCANVTRPNGQKTDNLNVDGPSAANSQKVSQMQGSGLLPNQINNQIVSNAIIKDQQAFPSKDLGATSSDPGVKTGLQEGFFNQLVRSLHCDRSLPLISGLINLVGGFNGFTYCAEKVDIANQNTYLIHDQSMALANSQKPNGLTFNPASSDCVLSDVSSQNGSSTPTTGDKKIDEVDTSFKTTYTQNLPPFKTSDIPQLDPNTKSNLSVGGYDLKDQRLPDVHQNCKLYEQSVFPKQLLGTNTDPSTGITQTSILNCPTN